MREQTERAEVSIDGRPIHRAAVALRPRDVLTHIDRSIASWTRSQLQGDPTAVHYLDCLRSLRRDFFGEGIPEGAVLRAPVEGEGE